MPKAVVRAGVIYPLEPLPAAWKDGQEVSVEVLGSREVVEPSHAEIEKPPAVSKERQEALLKLIGIWKTPQPPSDEEVDRILHQERMRKYG